jgi:hypothetical protein
MEKVSIRFENGVLDVRDETGARIATPRVTVYLVTGNDVPVALLDVDGLKREVHVTSFMVPAAAPVMAPTETVTEGAPKGAKR